jgi:hypothetical protein
MRAVAFWQFVMEKTHSGAVRMTEHESVDQIKREGAKLKAQFIALGS